jgi:hypothetical protein
MQLIAAVTTKTILWRGRRIDLINKVVLNEWIQTKPSNYGALYLSFILPLLPFL